MRIVALLILWSLPFLQTGGHETSVPPGVTNSARIEEKIAAGVMQGASDNALPDDPITGILAEDDDSLEDGSVDLCLWAGWQWQSQGRDNLSSLAPLLHTLLRIPSSPPPLRC
ncbi:MAG TPA: hypothetical protein VHX68_01645 [Planctomycetaceae bacterium]|jgi:hypothetical protein|nr:hypothetical protein [Planctomycetaceae bacterium]